MTNAQIYEKHGARGVIIRSMTAGKVMKYLTENAANYPKQEAAAE